MISGRNVDFLMSNAAKWWSGLYSLHQQSPLSSFCFDLLHREPSLFIFVSYLFIARLGIYVAVARLLIMKIMYDFMI